MLYGVAICAMMHHIYIYMYMHIFICILRYAYTDTDLQRPKVSMAGVAVMCFRDVPLSGYLAFSRV